MLAKVSSTPRTRKWDAVLSCQEILMTHTYIPEKEAAEKLGFKPSTLRRKAKGTGPYQGRDTLPIAFTTGGKGYRYSLTDIEKYLRNTSSK